MWSASPSCQCDRTQASKVCKGLAKYTRSESEPVAHKYYHVTRTRFLVYHLPCTVNVVYIERAPQDGKRNAGTSVTNEHMLVGVSPSAVRIIFVAIRNMCLLGSPTPSVGTASSALLQGCSSAPVSPSAIRIIFVAICNHPCSAAISVRTLILGRLDLSNVCHNLNKNMHNLYDQ